MFQLIEYKPEHAIEILEAGAREKGLVLCPDTIDFANTALDRGPCITAQFEGKIVGCSGIEIAYPGFGEMSAIYVDDVGKYHINPSFAKNWMLRKIEAHRLVRLQAPLRSDFPDGELYAEWIGFKFECRLECYHRDGSDALMYSIINKRFLEGI